MYNSFQEKKIIKQGIVIMNTGVVYNLTEIQNMIRKKNLMMPNFMYLNLDTKEGYSQVYRLTLAVKPVAAEMGVLELKSSKECVLYRVNKNRIKEQKIEIEKHLKNYCSSGNVISLDSLFKKLIERGELETEIKINNFDFLNHYFQETHPIQYQHYISDVNMSIAEQVAIELAKNNYSYFLKIEDYIYRLKHLGKYYSNKN
jgi:hypothetical protein